MEDVEYNVQLARHNFWFFFSYSLKSVKMRTAYYSLKNKNIKSHLKSGIQNFDSHSKSFSQGRLIDIVVYDT